jgi:hypothetical protein
MANEKETPVDEKAGDNTPADNTGKKKKDKKAGDNTPADNTGKKKKDKKAGGDITFVLQHPHLKTDASAGLYFQGEEITIKIKDGIFETEDRDLFEQLQREGWLDKTEYPVSKKEIPRPEPKKWFFRHSLGDQVSGSSIGLFNENGEEISVKLGKSGETETTKRAIAEQLEKAGFILDKTE